MDIQTIETILRGIIARRLPDVSPESITAVGELANLGVDSLAFSWIIADMEDEFDIEIKGADVLKLKTLANAIVYVENRLSR